MRTKIVNEIPGAPRHSISAGDPASLSPLVLDFDGLNASLFTARSGNVLNIFVNRMYSSTMEKRFHAQRKNAAVVEDIQLMRKPTLVGARMFDPRSIARSTEL